MLMAACIGKGDTISITADGADENEAIQTLVEAVEVEVTLLKKTHLPVVMVAQVVICLVQKLQFQQ